MLATVCAPCAAAIASRGRPWALASRLKQPNACASSSGSSAIRAAARASPYSECASPGRPESYDSHPAAIDSAPTAERSLVSVFVLYVPFCSHW